MATKFVTPIDLTLQELRNVRFQSLASAPTNLEAQVYYDSTVHAPFCYDGTAQISLDARKLVGAIPNGALTTNPLARANHTGTQLAATVSDFDTQVRTSRLDQMAAPSADVSLASHKLTNVTDPSGSQDAATKNYVDTNLQAAVAGISSKPAVRVASTANVVVATGTLLTIDGITLLAGDRVLLKNQTTGSENGVWIAASGAWARVAVSDSSPNSELALGSLWYVEQGTANGGSQWILNSPTSGAITPGTTAITIVKFSAGSPYTASLGVQLVGADFRASLGSGLTLSGNNIVIDTTIVARKYAASYGDGSTLAYVITHSLGTLDVVIQVVEVSTGNVVVPDKQATSTNTITLTHSVAPTTNQYRVTVLA